MESLVKKILIYTIEFLIAAVLLWWDQQIFFLYFFIALILKIDRVTDYLRGSIRVNAVIDEARILAISEHLGVPKESMSKIITDGFEKLSKKQKESLIKDFNDASLNIYNLLV